MSDVSLIGCRISIVSKAKIRYEGFLDSFEFDSPEEPVITLSKVWSYGTEDRPCERQVAPRNEEYNQVVFRKKDLEDAWIVQSSPFFNQDSAIVSASSGSTITQPGTEKSRTDPSAPGQIRNIFSPSPEVPQTPNAPSAPLNILSQKDSRASIPYNQPLPGVQRPVPIGTLSSEPKQAPGARVPRPFGDGRSETENNTSRYTGKYPNKPLQGQPTENFRSVFSGPTIGSTSAYDNRETRGRPNSGNPQLASSDHRSPTDGYSNFQRRRGGHNGSWSENQRSSRYQSGPNRRGYRPGFPSWSQPRAGVSMSIAGSTNYFDEYDYESANAVLAAELEKISLSGTKSTSSLDGDFHKGDESGRSVTGEESSCYDKQKSFFDKISSELLDKSNGISSQPSGHRNERLLNSATFGPVASQYPRRGGGYYGSRFNGRYSSYTYGQRRGGGGGQRGYRKPFSNHPAKISPSPAPPLTTNAERS